MFKDCASSVPVYRMLVYSGFGYSFACVEDDASDNIQMMISLGSGLMCNYAAVCGGRLGLKILVRNSSYMWK